MIWIKNNLVFLIAIALIIAVVIMVIQFDGGTTQGTGIVVLSTALIAISSLGTYMQAVEMRRQRESAERPDVAVYFQPTNRLMYCIIHNLGNLAVTNVRIHFKPSPVLHDGRKLEDLSLFAKSIPFLPPKEKYWRHLGASPDVIQRNREPFEIIVEYQSSEGKTFKNRFIVDFAIMSEANDPELSISSQLAIMSARLDKFVQAIETDRLMRLAQDDNQDT